MSFIEHFTYNMIYIVGSTPLLPHMWKELVNILPNVVGCFISQRESDAI